MNMGKFGHSFLIFALTAGLGGCGWLSGPDKIRAPYLGAAAVVSPMPAVRVLVSRDARDPTTQSIESIELVAPDGKRYSPNPDQLSVSRQPYSYASWPELRVSGSSRQIPENVAVAPPAERRSEFINVTALIEIPDLESYRRWPDQWTIAVQFSGANGERKRALIPAPPLPPTAE